MTTHDDIANTSIVSVLKHLYHQEGLKLEDLLVTTPQTEAVKKQLKQTRLTMNILIGLREHYEFIIKEESIYGKSDVTTRHPHGLWNEGNYNKEFIIEKLHKFENIFSKRGGKCYNLSTADWTLLPFEKMNYEDF